MTYGQGRIFKRHRTWWIAWWSNGEEHRESTKSTDRDVALKKLHERQLLAGQGEKLDLTLEDLRSLMTRDYEINARKTKPPLGRVFEYFGADCKAVDITPAAATRYIEHRFAQGAAAQTIKGELGALGRGLTLAWIAGYLPRRPRLPAPRVSNARQGFFEEDEFRAILRHLPAHMRPVVEFAYFTGWRRGEIFGLQWRQVDFRARTIRLEPGTTKNDEARTFPFGMFPRLERLLEQRRVATTKLERERGEVIPWVFTLDGQRMRGWYYDAWRTACKRAGLPGKLMHDFRRTVVRNLERAGVPRSVAMKLTGHKTESIYRRYAIVSESDLSAGVEKLAKLYNDETRTRPVQQRVAGSRQSQSEVASPTRFELVLPP